MRNSISAILSGVSLMAVATPAFAQSVPTNGNAATEDKDIVVTGTLIRGKAPVGSNQITLGAAKIEEVAAISGNALLASIAQVSNYFNRVPIADLGIAINQIQISRPNLRNISPNNAASSATLILVDGHRVATAGVNQASIDRAAEQCGGLQRRQPVLQI
jgi:iron complex outermembrane recepter protein